MTLLLYGALLITLWLWFKTLTTAVRQRELTTGLLALLKRAEAASQDALRYSKEQISQAEVGTHSAALGPGAFIYPARQLRRNVSAAREILGILEFSRRDLPNEIAQDLGTLLDAEQKLLAGHSATRDYRCRHEGYSSRDDQFIVTLAHGQHLNIAEWKLWCRYCLASWSVRQQLPVIVKPPR